MTTTAYLRATVDQWVHTLELRAAQNAVNTAAESGDSRALRAAVRVLLTAAARHAWPTAAALVFKRESVGTFSGFWALYRVTDPGHRVLRAWEDDSDEMRDESDEERVALDLISNRPETQDYAQTFVPLRARPGSAGPCRIRSSSRRSCRSPPRRELAAVRPQMLPASSGGAARRCTATSSTPPDAQW